MEDKTMLITGATGMIGGEISQLAMDDGWKVHYLTRSDEKIKDRENYKGFHWDVKEQTIDADCIKGVSVIINLAGASIAERWTDEYKEVIINSRVNSLKLLKKLLDENDHQVKHLISASAVGVYPDSKTNYYKETQQKLSDTFLGDVVEKWETAADKFKDDGLTVSKIRIGLVLSEKGGALPQMLKPIKIGLGAPLGSGKQWQSWIHLQDLARIFLFVAGNELSGIYNGVAPNPVTNKELTTMSANVLDKPLILPNVPKFALKFALGEMHIILFESQRVSSEKIESEGFHFNYPNLKPALQDLLV